MTSSYTVSSVSFLGTSETWKHLTWVVERAFSLTGSGNDGRVKKYMDASRYLTSQLRCSLPVLYLLPGSPSKFQLSANAKSGKQQCWPSSYHQHGRCEWSSCPLASLLLSPGHLTYLGSKSTDGHSLPLHVCISVIHQIKTEICKQTSI